ncbi:MAG TPA: hypothetical protein VFO82_04135 [Steroidobacteraceae bacterium]|nr:hypothetical protein [Steroidobacteraceae bacterium]
MPHRASVVAIVTMLTFADTATASPPAKPAAQTAAGTTAGCFAVGGGYLRARMRGALDLDLNWKNEEMLCEGGPRPPGKNNSKGVRVSIGGPPSTDGHRLRLVFGIAGVGEGGSGQALRTNLTILFEGEQRIFATQGDDKCTVDSLTQERVEVLGPERAVYRVVARGFCLGPATSLSRNERVLLTSFDFAGRVEFGDDDRRADEAAKP